MSAELVPIAELINRRRRRRVRGRRRPGRDPDDAARGPPSGRGVGEQGGVELGGEPDGQRDDGLGGLGELGGHPPRPAAGGGRRPRRRAARSCSGAPTPARRRSATSPCASTSPAACRWRTPGRQPPAGVRDERGPPAGGPRGPLRLIAPGWYGVANVKWLTRDRGARHPPDEPLHGPRLRHPPRGAARRGGGRAGVGGDLGGPLPAQVRAGEGDPAGRAAPHPRARPGARPSPGWRRGSTTGPGCRRRSTAPRGRTPPSPGRCGRWTGAPRRPGSMPSPRGPPTPAGGVQPAPDDPWLAGKRTYWESTGQVTRRVLVRSPGR